MIKIIKYIFCLFLLIFTTTVNAAEKNNFSLDFQDAPIQIVLHLLARIMQLNVVISPAIRDTVCLHLQNMSPKDAFNLLLVSHHLSQRRIGGTIFIAPQEELLKEHLDNIKLQEAEIQVAPLKIQVWQIHYAKAEEIAHLLQGMGPSILSKRGQVHVDCRTNQICVQDIPSVLEQIHHLIQQIDIPVQQVLIQARLVSMDHDYEQELGINFDVQRDKDTSLTSAVRFGLALIKLPDGGLLDIQLAAMEKNGRGELISSPSLFTANQQLASIEAGEEIPYQEVSKSGATSVAFKKAVLSLRVVPQIMPNNNILLQLQVNQDKPNQRSVLGVPAINTRQIQTNVLIKNGQTIVLGGIYESDKENNQQRIPFLGKIPLIGLLFQQQDCQLRKRELLIFVTPKIVPLIG